MNQFKSGQINKIILFTIRRRWRGLLVCCVSAISMSAAPLPSKAAEGSLGSDGGTYVQVCSVRQNPTEYIGRVIRFRVTYESDHLFYAFISDPSCSKHKTIDVQSSIRTHGDDSVTEFFKDEDERCKASVCPVEANIDVEALVSQVSDRSLLVEFKRIIDYRFLPYSRKAKG